MSKQFLLCVLCAAATLAAQAPPPAPQPAKPVAPRPVVARKVSPVDQVIQMTKAKVSEALIIKQLQKANKPVELSGDDMVKLKEAGVSEQVILVLMDPATTPAAASATSPATTVPAATAVAPAPSSGPGSIFDTAPEPAAASPSPAPTAASPGPPPPPPAPVVTPAPAPLPPPAPAPVRAKPAVTTGMGLDWKGKIRAAVEAQYPVSQATADRTDIVSFGGVMALNMNSLVFTTRDLLGISNSYKNGKLTPSIMASLCKGGRSGECRTFVRSEKFWLMDVTVKDDGLNLTFISDPMPESRFVGVLKFPITKGTQPAPEELLPLVAQVISVAAPPPAPQAAAPQPQAPQAPQASGVIPVIPPAPTEALAPVVPPPPGAAPAAAPAPGVLPAVGQSREQVLAMLGNPTKQSNNPGGVQVLNYPTVVVTIVAGRVVAVTPIQ